jgi:hypothetical protein
VSLFAATLLLCTGIAFESPVRYPVSADQVVLLAHADILTSGDSIDRSDAFSRLASRGDGTFDAEQRLAGTFGDELEAIVDLNGDGQLDVIASNYWNNGIAIAGTVYPTATHGGPTRVVDYDRDGIADVISFSFGSGNPVRVHLFRGRGDGTFDAKQTFTTDLTVAASPSLRMHDGATEFIAGNHSGQVAIYRVTPGGVSVTTRDVGPEMDLAAIFADVNGDGIADIVDANESGQIFVTLADGDEFRTRMEIARLAFPTQLHAADLNGDNNLDLIAGDFRANELHYYRGNGDGTFGRAIAIDTGGPVNDVAIGDINGDQRPDLMAVTNDHAVSVIVNRGHCGGRRRSVGHGSRERAMSPLATMGD